MTENITITSRKFMNNPLLQRKQMIIDVRHPHIANVSRKEMKEQIAKRYKIDNPNTIVLFGFRTAFGGNKSTGFALLYNSPEAVIKFEPKHRLVRMGLIKKEEKSRKQIKELKNRRKKVRGKKKAK